MEFIFSSTYSLSQVIRPMVKIFFLNLLINFLNIIMMYPFWRKTKSRTKTVAQRPTHDPDHKTVAQIETSPGVSTWTWPKNKTGDETVG